MMCIRHRHLSLSPSLFFCRPGSIRETPLPSGLCMPHEDPPYPLQGTSGLLTFVCAECINLPLGAECAATVDLKAPVYLSEPVHFIVGNKCWILCSNSYTHMCTHTHTHARVPMQPGTATKLSCTVARVTWLGQTS